MAEPKDLKRPAIPGVNVDLDELLRLKHAPGASIKPANILALNSGQHLSRVRGRGMDFSEVRRYQAGDDIRQMEWRVTARTGRAHVKRYHEEKERPVFLVVDFNPSMFFGTKVAFKSVVAARFAAMLGFAASQNGDKVGGVVYSSNKITEIRPRARQQGILPLLNCLSESSFLTQQKQEPRPFSEVLLKLRRVAKPGSLVFFLSDFGHFDTEARDLLLRLRQRLDLIAFHLTDNLEKKPPKKGVYPVTDGINEAIINTRERDFSARYQACYQQRIETLSPLFKPGHFIELCTDDDLKSTLASSFMLTQKGRDS